MKLLIRFFLSLSFIFLYGCSNIYASSYEHPIACPPLKILENSKNTSLLATAHQQTSTVRFAPPATKRSNQKGLIAEDEDENDDENNKISFLKKQLTTGNYLTSLHAHASRSLCCRIKKRLPIGAFFSGYSSPTYILFRVIRI